MNNYLELLKFMKKHGITTTEIPTLGTWQASIRKPRNSERASSERLAVLALARRLELEGHESI